jgi:DNA-binding XRE family transcriptional regulator
MLVLEKTHPTELVITGQPDELEQVERMLDFLHKDEKALEKEGWVDGDTVQQEILEYLGVPLGALMLKHYRESRGLSHEALADTLGTSPQNIRNLENGKDPITPEIAEEFATFFHVTAQTFLKK